MINDDVAVGEIVDFVNYFFEDRNVIVDHTFQLRPRYLISILKHLLYKLRGLINNLHWVNIIIISFTSQQNSILHFFFTNRPIIKLFTVHNDLLVKGNGLNGIFVVCERQDVWVDVECLANVFTRGVEVRDVDELVQV